MTMTRPQQAVPTADFVRTHLPLRAPQGIATGLVRYAARMSRSATCVWRVDAALVLALDERLGPPVDSYLNGSQTWLTDDGPAGEGLEWRLHPVAGYRLPRDLSHYDLWEQIVGALSAGADPDALTLGSEPRTLRSLWDGLECFAAYGDDLEPAPLAAGGHHRARPRARRRRSGRPRTDRHRMGARRGATSIVEMLFAELKSTA